MASVVVLLAVEEVLEGDRLEDLEMMRLRLLSRRKLAAVDDHALPSI